MKAYQWRMATKLQAEAHVSKIDIAKQTARAQNFEIEQLRSQIETVRRSFVLKCDELARAEKDRDFKEWENELMMKAYTVILDRIEKQEKAQEMTEELTEKNTGSLVELINNLVNLRIRLGSLEEDKKQTEAALLAAKEETTSLSKTLIKSCEENETKIGNLKKLLEEKIQEIEGLDKLARKANDEKDAMEREVDNYKALRHKELRENGEELKAANEKVAHLTEAISKAEDENKAMVENLKKLVLCKVTENEELEKRLHQANVDICAKQQELDSNKTQRHKDLREKCEELQSANKKISSLTEDLSKSEEENEVKIDNMKKLVLCKDKEIEDLEKAQQYMVQEHKDFLEGRSLDHDAELRKKNSLIKELEEKVKDAKAEMQKKMKEHKDFLEAMSLDHDAELRKKNSLIKKSEEENKVKIDNMKKLVLCKDKEIEDLEKARQYMEQEHKDFLEGRSLDHDAELRKKNSLIKELEEKVKDAEAENNRTKEQLKLQKSAAKKQAPAKASSPAKRKRTLIDTYDLSDAEEGKLFDDFFNKPKKTYSKTPVKNKFFKHTRGQTSL